MRVLWLGFILFCSSYAFGETARVLLDTIAPDTMIQGHFRVTCLRWTGEKTLVPLSCQRNHKSGNPSNEHAAVSFRASRFTIDESPGRVEFRIGNGRSLFRLYGNAFRFKGSFRWQGRTFKKLDLILKGNTSKWVVHLPLENYLQGVLGAEVPASWPIEALKAQAVASRSYFLWKQDLKKSYYDVRSDHMDQVFQIKKKTAPKIVKAIRATKGIFLRSEMTRATFPAFFHSDCGGDTATEHAVWRKPASENQPIVDRVCQSASENIWTRTLMADELTDKLRTKMLLPRGATLSAVIPRGRKGQRAHSVDFLFNNNIIKNLSANEFRKVMGFGRIKSTRFQVYKKDGQFVFKGQGYGHGVGMCQWGAKRWASLGKNFRQILSHYYPTAQLRQKGKKSFPSVAER